MTFNEINVLGNIVNTTFGKSSSPDGSNSIKCDLAGDVLTLKYTCVVHFGSESSLREQVGVYKEEAQQKLSAYLKNIKSEFKNATGTTFKVSNSTFSDSVDLISSQANVPRKVAYYRMNCVVTLGSM